MLSCVLNSEKAIQLNIQIVRIFTKIRELLADTLSVKLEIEEIKKKLEKQENPKPRSRAGFKRQSEDD